MAQMNLKKSIAVVAVILSLPILNCEDGEDGNEKPSRVDGATLVYSPPGGASAQNPAFSPAGEHILFTLFHNGYEKGPAGLYLYSNTHRSANPLLDDNESDAINKAGRCWTADSDRITFSSNFTPGYGIWTVRRNGKELKHVITHAEKSVSFVEPCFSPVGPLITFEYAYGEGPYAIHLICRVSESGEGYSVLSRGNGQDSKPEFNPSGKRIVYQHRQHGEETNNWDLYTMDYYGGDINKVTSWEGPDIDASWSPAGSHIAYASHTGELPTMSIFVIGAGGGTPVQITKDPNYEDGSPSWSPDGKWIVFESRPVNQKDAPASLWRIAAPETN
jgi:TolB protein